MTLYSDKPDKQPKFYLGYYSGSEASIYDVHTEWGGEVLEMRMK